MLLSIIIINYKSAGLILDCINSVYTMNDNVAVFEIIVVDNDSGDSIELLLKDKYPAVRFIQMGYNSGFARANNEGIRQAISDIVLLLNPDTICTDNSISRCLQKFISSRFIACGVQLVNADGSPQISGNYVMKGGLNYLLPLPYVGAFLRFIAFSFGVKKPNIPDATGTMEVDWINGAFLMVKKQAITNAGLLDEDFFLYAEEAEWCSRLKKAGPLCIYGDEHIIHLQGESAATAFDSPDKGYFNLYDLKGLQIMVSNFLRIRKQFGTGWYLFNLGIYIFTIPVFLSGLILSRIFNGNKSRYSFKQFKGFCSNMNRLIGLAGKMISNKPYFYKVL